MCAYIQIIAAKDIPHGTELTHSYVELVEPTDKRKQTLLKAYGFSCMCSRCTLNNSAGISKYLVSIEESYLRQLPVSGEEVNSLITISDEFAASASFEFFLPSFKSPKAYSDVEINTDLAGSAIKVSMAVSVR